jgi:hypothetical protein
MTMRARVGRDLEPRVSVAGDVRHAHDDPSFVCLEPYRSNVCEASSTTKRWALGSICPALTLGIVCTAREAVTTLWSPGGENDLFQSLAPRVMREMASAPLRHRCSPDLVEDDFARRRRRAVARCLHPRNTRRRRLLQRGCRASWMTSPTRSGAWSAQGSCVRSAKESSA